jgi:mannose/fructose/N-acetylgalactosamine-specific phosphotransferase system component IIB
MPLILARIDDRLIHGQVVLGWSPVLKPDRIAVVNDRVAGNSWERKLYAASVPPHIKVSFSTLDEGAVDLQQSLHTGESVLALFESVADVHAVVARGVQLPEVNVGGLHYREGTRELLPFVFLTHDDRRLLGELARRGVKLLAQDLPGNAVTVLNPMVS